MDEIITKQLQTAYALIKSGQAQQACEILIPLVRENPNLVDGWFLLGHAVTEKPKKIQCFQQVLRIDPSHAAAQKQLTHLMAPPVVAPFFVETEPSTPPVMPPGPVSPPLEMSPAPVLRPVAARAAQKKTSARRWVWLGLVAGTLMLVLVGFGLWWGLNQGLPVRPVPTAALEAVIPPTLTSLPVKATTAPSPTPAFTPVFRGTACPFDIPLGTRVKCGVVKVPQNRTKNFTDLIELPVVVFQSAKPNADVIIYLQGGPGEEAIDWSLALFDEYVTPVLQNYDMVFFDPRGTGRSKPALDCPELNSVFLDAYFQNRSEAEAFKDFNAAWEKCHNRFLAEGVDPAAFNTTQSAGDVRDIAVALGYQKVNLLGISYGTRLGLTVMRDYPEIVRAVVLDSVVPMQAKMFNRRGSDVQYALQKVFSDCAASPRCNQAYPNLETVFNALVEKFDREPVTIKAFSPASGFNYEIKANGVDLLSAVVWGLHNSELVPVVPKAIYDIERGDYTFLSFALGVPGNEYNTLGMGTYFATVCPEQVYASTPQEVDADLNLSPVVKKFALAGLFGSSQRVFDLCQAWGARAHQAEDSLPVTANLPVLIISGQYDPTTPVTTGEMVKADLPNSHFYVIPGMGHGATVGNDCSFTLVMGFLADPTQVPDSACLPLATFEFFLPYDGQQPVAVVPINDASRQFQGVVPAGWKKDFHYPVYYRRAYLFDPTLVDYESFPGSKSQVITSLTHSFAQRGFDETPKKTGSYAANGLDWTIYSSTYNGEPVMVGLAQVSRYQTLGVIMVTSAPERSAYYRGLFLPILEAYAPR